MFISFFPVICDGNQTNNNRVDFSMNTIIITFFVLRITS
jgi:hypothetical protein